MRHYEIVALVHPDQSEQTDQFTDRYREIIERSGGTVHRYENWGRRKLAYPINKIYKAGYFLLNIECDSSVKDELENSFRYNDAILRTLVVRMDHAVKDVSPIMQRKLEEDAEEQERLAAEELARQKRAAEIAESEKQAAEKAAQEEAAQAKTVQQKADESQDAVGTEDSEKTAEPAIEAEAAEESESQEAESKEDSSDATDTSQEESEED